MDEDIEPKNKAAQLNPAQDVRMAEEYQLSDIIDTAELKLLLDNYCNSVGIAAAILNLKGDVLVASHWQRICTDFHRVNKTTGARCLESDTELALHLDKSEHFSLYKCKNGMTDAASPIIVEGRHLGNVFVGQFLLAPPDREYFGKQAQQFGFDESSYFKALDEVLVIPEEKLPSILGFLCGFATMVASTGLQKIRAECLSIRLAKQSEALEMEVKMRTGELREAQRIAHLGSWQLDIASRHVVWSEELYLMQGLHPKSSPPDYSELEKFFTPESWERLSSALTRTLESGIPYELELEMVKPDQSHGWMLARGEAIRDAGGSIVALRGVGIDITERKLAEEAIRSAAQYTRSLIEVSLDPLVTISAEGKITDVNTATEKVTGVNRSHLVGSDFADYFTDPEKAREGYRQAFSQGFVTDYPLAIRHVSGKITDVLYNASLYRDSNGNVLGVFAAARDVTARKRAELEAAALIHRNHVLMQSTSEGIHVLDEQGNVIEANEAFCRHLGYTMEEVLQLSVFDFDAKLTADELRANLKEMQNGQTIFETVHRRKDGALVDVEINISGVDLDGQKCLFALGRDITQKKETEQIIWKQANYDALTGLPNRHMFHDRVAQEIKKSTRSGAPFALMFIDLDHFKEVNDTLGHDMGDRLLIEATRRIGDCVRATDTLARMGGDEFTVLLTEVDDLGSVERIAQNIRQKLADSFQLKREVVYVSASIGITLYPNDAANIEGLLKNADQAMYVAKEQGRNRYSYFTPALQQAAQAKLRLINDLRGALAAGQFRVYFQPVVELVTGHIHKAEALIRWQHPERGFVGPAQFIPLAEETGLILEIGDWVFHESMRYAKRWRTLYDPVFQVSVNKSPIQFYKDGDEHSAWLSYLKEMDLPGQCLAIEITEGLLLDSNASINGALLTLRNADIQVSIDDFGTGYSSLAYLKKFDIDYLKIDQSFVQNLEEDHNDMVLCEAIIVMAHKLGIKVIAEGVETAEQRDLLAAAGCDYAQGYWYSWPVPADEFEGLLKRGGL